MDYRWKWRRLGVVVGRYWRRQQVGEAIGGFSPFGEAWSHLGTRSLLKGLAALTRPTSPLAIRLLHPPLPISLLHPFPPIRSPSLRRPCTMYQLSLSTLPNHFRLYHIYTNTPFSLLIFLIIRIMVNFYIYIYISCKI